MTMTSIKKLGIIAVAAVMATGSAASAQSAKVAAANTYDGPLPPAGYDSRRWTHPNGCDYSLAGRPGERVWYVVVNTTAGRDCISYFVEKAFANDISVTKNLYRYK